MSEIVERVAKAVQETASSMGAHFDRFVAAEVARAAISEISEILRNSHNSSLAYAGDALASELKEDA